ncbi:uncharacterized protein LOC125946410 [Dermacentor silvarum]|uniref:uncharacterized protein LOC125946410 n=1 Tax=Dermacentor silvarum TaxID=543639 RepID=UPI0021011C25|nr:uncharacterized protein LOC125946410 [Dermacentor silvarum]
MTCCAFGCPNTCSKGKRLFSIPSGKRDGLRRKAWIHRIGRKNFIPTPSTRLCEVFTLLRDHERRCVSGTCALPNLSFGKKNMNKKSGKTRHDSAGQLMRSHLNAIAPPSQFLAVMRPFRHPWSIGLLESSGKANYE